MNICRKLLGLVGPAALAMSLGLIPHAHAQAERIYTVTWIPQEFGPTDMNNAGNMVGMVFTLTGPRIATWSDETGVQILPGFGGSFGMNNHGDFVAMKDDGPPERRYNAYAYINREWRNISAAAPDIGWVFPHAINDRGWVVGEVAESQYATQISPFLYRNGDLQVLPTLGGSSGKANAINNRGQVTGQAARRNPDGSESRHAFLYDSARGRMTDLGTLGGGSSEGLDINERGQVVGMSNWRGFFYSGGRMIDVGTLGGNEAFALAINNDGVVVGRGWLQDNTPYGFVYFAGRMVNLDRLVSLPPGWSVWVPLSINDRFQILATVCHPVSGGSACAVARLDPPRWAKPRELSALIQRLGQANPAGRAQALEERLDSIGQRIRARAPGAK